jgi:hypothetical protein
MQRLLLPIPAGRTALGASQVEVPADRRQDQIGGGLSGHIIGGLNGRSTSSSRRHDSIRPYVVHK